MAPKKDTKDKKPKFEVHEPKKVPREEADREMDKLFEKIEGELKDVPQDVIEEGANKVLDFIKGKVSWGEIFNIGPETLKQIAEIGYVKFQAGRMEEAERFYKVLTILQSKNSYFHSMLGTILQREKRYGEAIVQFTDAIDLNPTDVISLVSRGEIFMMHGWLNDAMLDFKKVISLDPKNENKWGKRARILKEQLEKIREKKKESSEGKNKKKK